MSCHSTSKSNGKASDGKNGKPLTFALAGNANVGKSVIFNQLTGSNQIIGNWPGKTVDRAEGTLSFEGHEIKVIDLLNDQTELLEISQNNSNWDVRKAAFKKLNNNSLDIIIRDAKDPALILSANIRLGHVSWNEAFSGNKSSTITLNHVIGAAAIVDMPQPTSYDVVSACHKFIQLGDASRIPELIFLLNKFGDVTLAEDYMNCGESSLEAAGCSWGRSHGYTCTTGNGSNRVRWGSKK